MARQRILLTGIPATGKTTLGNHLKNNHGFTHVDFEDGVSLNQFVADPDAFLESLSKNDKVVISWGFCPDEIQTPMVNYLKTKGFNLFWLDGDHVSALREYIRRNTGIKSAFYYQMFRIESFEVISKITPTVINTFNPRGEFKELAEITRELGII